jgi:hypothetical protein
MTSLTAAVAVCLLQRFAGLVEQPVVLHCDDRLSGEILQ